MTVEEIEGLTPGGFAVLDWDPSLMIFLSYNAQYGRYVFFCTGCGCQEYHTRQALQTNRIIFSGGCRTFQL